MDLNLKDKIFMVSGGAKGIGESIVSCQIYLLQGIF